MWTTWWIWMAAGVVLAVLETIVPAYIFLGFAVGAFGTGGLLWIGVPLAANLPLLFFIFALLSLLAWIVLRKSLGVRDGQVKTFDHDVNDG